MSDELLRARLGHILTAIAAIRRYVADKNLEEFTNDRQLIDAVERNIERVSEASRHLPEELKTGFSYIPWREIAGIGNVLRHDYPSILPREIWATVTGDLPELEAAVSAMIEEIEAKRE
ncbi:MAG: DUF86 domain-containing protein [Alphaproteobacteria bacterium]|jgi:uncharacterized protein with HEPN domain|nr:DUF86 domain-containing protein [Alphaproteobacteria bacterium]